MRNKCKHKNTELILNRDLMTIYWCRECGAIKSSITKNQHLRWRSPKVSDEKNKVNDKDKYKLLFLKKEIMNGRFINAVRELREYTRSGLAECKHFCDSIKDGYLSDEELIKNLKNLRTKEKSFI